MVNFQSFLECFGTFAAFVAGITTFTELFKKLFKVTKKGWMITISWILAIIGAFVGFYFQVGFLAEYGTPDMWQGWVMTALTGLGAGIAANGLYDQSMIEALVKWIWSFINTTKKPQTINE